MKYWWARALLLLVLYPGGALIAETPSLESLRLGSRYLRWVPSQETAARGAMLASRPEATAPERPVASELPIASELPTPPALPEGLALIELEELSRRNNPTLSQAAHQVQAARAKWLQAGLYPNPRIGYQANEIGDEGQSGKQGAFVGQEFFTAGKLQRGRDVAHSMIQQAEYAWQAQCQRVLSDVRRAFYDVLVAQRAVELTKQLVRIGQEGERATESLFEAQEVSRVDVLQARVEADSARILAEKARHRHLAAWRNLAVVVGIADMPLTPLAGDPQDGLARLSWEDVLQRVLSNSPALAKARAGVAQAEAILGREYAERIPNIDMLAGVAYDNATHDTIAEVEVGFPLPLFNRNQGDIRKAQVELSMARSEVRRVELELRQRLASTFEQYQNARYESEKYADNILPNAQASLDLVTSGYRQGEFDYVTLLTAQRTFFQVNLAYVDSIRELRSSVVAIESYLLSHSLQQQPR